MKPEHHSQPAPGAEDGNKPLFRALGMISGTSIDGIDTALIETDGHAYVRPIAFMPHSYAPTFRARLRACFGKREGVINPDVAAFEGDLTKLHAQLVQEFIQKHNLVPGDIALIGFHGQTIWHSPESRQTIQLGDGALLAQRTGIPVVNDFRSADVQAGGHGAPLVPLYHNALAARLLKPAAIINIGGVSNITWIGGPNETDILAFDLGPGNALLDDWVLRHTGQPYDENGKLAARGQIEKSLVQNLLTSPFFRQPPPKSLDREAFHHLIPDNMAPEHGAATLTRMTAAAIAEGLRQVPAPPRQLYIAGGGRHNVTMMRWIEDLTGLPTLSVDQLGWSGDGLEAEAFAYLAVRSRLGLPLSLPRTTGVKAPTTGGRYHPAIAS